jgi:hypothetical protein
MIQAIDQISKCLRLIKVAPRDNEFFYVEDDTNSCLIDGKMIKMLPSEYNKYSKFDEFWIHIDADNRTINFVVYNIADFITNSHKDEERGILEWNKMLIPIATFFVANLQLLCSAIATINSNTSATTSHGSNMTNDAETRFGSKTPTQYPYYKTPHDTSAWEASYKERNTIKERFEALIKENKTGAAIEFINIAINKMCDEKKFSSLDLLMFALPDTMNMPTMIAILKATAGADHLMKDRKIIFERAMKKFNSNKSTKMIEVINALAPGKEYAGIKKYSNDTDTKTN